MQLNKFIEQNHNWLLEVSAKITASDINASEIKFDLLSFVTICIIESKRYNNLELQDYKFIFAKYLKDNYRWTSGAFWKSQRLLSDTDLNAPKQHYADEQFIDIMADCEKDCDEELELITKYNDDGVNKIKFVREAERKMKPHNKILFDLYITNRLSLSQISKKLNISKTQAHNITVELKREIITLWNQSQSSSQHSPVSGTSLPNQIYQKELSA